MKTYRILAAITILAFVAMASTSCTVTLDADGSKSATIDGAAAANIGAAIIAAK